MTGLDYFGARNLAARQHRAVRRAGWHWWLMKPFALWLRVDIDDLGRETRRVVTTDDRSSSDFLAKDYTDEPWEGGLIPACAEIPPATELAQGSGGLGTWTLTDRCSGAGTGGGVLPPLLPDGTGPGTTPPVVYPPVYVFAAYALVQDDALSDISPHTPLTPDAGGCWVTPPATCSLAIVAYYADPVTGLRSPTNGPGRLDYLMATYVSPSGADLSAAQHAPFSYGSQQWGRVGATVGPESSYSFPNLTGFIRVVDDTVVLGVIRRHFPYLPGSTITIRVDEQNGLDHPERVHLHTFTFPPLCGYDDSGAPVGEP